MAKIIRRVIAVLLCATAVMLAVLPAGAAEATSAHGDYEYDGATVSKYLGNDVQVTLPAWVNRVGKEAFEGYDRMTELYLPDSVTTVDFGAFSNCKNLDTVRMSQSVRTLGSGAFSGCEDLYSISLPKSVREIGSGVFAGCTSLANVPISAANENYTSYDGVIYSADGKKLVQYLPGRPYTTYQMPVSVREIGEYAFWGANNLSKLSISYGVDKIPEYAFSNCKGLQHVTLPRSVQSIFAYAFEDCDSLSYINIPNTIGYIDDRAFANTKGAVLRLVDESGNVVKTFNSEDVDEYGSGTGGSTMVTPPDYSDPEKLKEANGTGNGSGSNTGTDNSSGNGSTSASDSNTDNNGNTTGNTAGSTSNDNNSNNNNNGSTSGTPSGSPGNGSTTYYEDGTTSGGGTFDPTDVTPLDEGDTPDDGNSARGNGTTPEGPQKTAPENVGIYNNGYYKASDSGSNPWDTQIEHHDFEDNMTEYDLGGGKVLGGVAVLRMSKDVPVKGFNLDGADYEDVFTGTAGRPVSDDDVNGDVYVSYSGNDENVNVPAGVTRVGSRAFYKKDNLKSVELPGSITDIGEFAFSRSGISSIDLPEGTKSIDYAAFYMCPNLREVYIPQSVENIALGAFDGTPFLEGFKTQPNTGDYMTVGDGILLSYRGSDRNVVIPEGVKHIGPAAFAGNSAIQSVTVPGYVEDIGEEAFCDCNNLRQLILENGVRNIEDRAFKNSALTAVSIPESVTGIGLSAFDNGGKLESVIFNGNSVPNVTYDGSATRLSAKDLRTNAFEGTKNAIVSNNCNLDDGTMMNPKFYGFKGTVYSISPEDNRSLIIERVLQEPDGNGNVSVNQNVTIAGQDYTVGQIKSDAFDFYRNWNDYYDNRPVKVSVNGEQSDDLVSLLDSVNSSVLADAEAEDETANKSKITVDVNGKRFPTRGSARAEIPGDNDRYALNISEDESATDRINAAFLHATGVDPLGDFVPLSVDLYDKSGSVPIHKLGNSKMEVSLPVPSGMENDEGVGIAYIDDNGCLETLSSEITEDENGKNLKFVTGHCSTYVIYSRSKKNVTRDEDGNIIETVDEENAAGSAGIIGGTWQTINKSVYGFPVKWFIIVILLALAAILMLYRPSNKRRKG